jgi:ADP-ribose pyrophosphatase
MQDKSTYEHGDVRLLEQQVVYQGYFQLLKYHLQHRLFQGNWSEPMQREVFVRGEVAGALLYDPIVNKVVLVEQFRVGALRGDASPWLLEIVAGVLDTHDTDAQSLAKREVKEEAGLDTLDILPIFRYWASPGACDERVSLFCARVDASKAGGIFGLSAEHEDIRVVVLSAEQAFEKLAQGLICNALTIIALQWLQLNKSRIDEKWLGSADNGLVYRNPLSADPN